MAATVLACTSGILSIRASGQVVTNTNDSGLGSLRDVVASTSSLAPVTFAPSLSGQTLTLGGTVIEIHRTTRIDASALTGGITISGGGEFDFPGEWRAFV